MSPSGPLSSEPGSEPGSSSTEPVRREVVLRLPLRPAPRLSRRLVVNTGLFVLLGLGLTAPLLESLGPGWLFPLVAVALPVLVLGYFWLRAPAAPAPLVEVAPERLALPLGERGEISAQVRWRELTALFLKEGRGGFLWIGTEPGSFIFPLSRFVRPDDARRLFGVIRAHIGELPDGEARLARFDAASAPAAVALARPLVAAPAMVAVLGAIYLAQHLLGAFDMPFGPVRFGASSKLLIGEGELFRLISANFLHHEHLFHLLFNGLAIVVLGAAVERLFGKGGFLLIYLVSAIFGAAASVLSSQTPIPSLGASTAAFGLLGAFAFTAFRYRERMPLGFRPPLGWWVLVLGLNALIPFVVQLSPGLPMIDVPAHLGGFLGGVVVSALLIGDDPPLPLLGLARVARAALFAVTAVTVGGLGVAAHHASTSEDGGATRVLEAMVAHFESVGAGLNALAWEVATRPGSTEAQLSIAEGAAARALAREDDDRGRAAIADTLATVRFRLGDVRGAIELEREALERLPARGFAAEEGFLDRLAFDPEDRFFATQLARFLEAWVDQHGPLVVDAGELPPVRLRVEAGGRFARIEGLGGPQETPLTVYALARVKGARVGLVRLVVPPWVGEPPPLVLGHPDAEGDPRIAALLDQVELLEVALVVSGDLGARIWPSSVQAAVLPHHRS